MSQVVTDGVILDAVVRSMAESAAPAGTVARKVNARYLCVGDLAFCEGAYREVAGVTNGYLYSTSGEAFGIGTWVWAAEPI